MLNHGSNGSNVQNWSLVLLTLIFYGFINEIIKNWFLNSFI
jgi:hypothetical protein